MEQAQDNPATTQEWIVSEPRGWRVDKYHDPDAGRTGLYYCPVASCACDIMQKAVYQRKLDRVLRRRS